MTPTPIAYRIATPEDADAIARIQTDGWRHAYRGMMPDRLLNGPLLEDHQLLWSRLMASGRDPAPLLALADGAPVGFCASGRTNSGLPYEGEIFALYIDQAWTRHGIGRRLMLASARRFLAEGKHSLMLWTLQLNTRARAFYESLGGIAVGEEQHCFGGTWLTEIAYGWAETETLIAQAEQQEKRA
jgi:ribosomal protein S18 acetylase RimI-like enzyme